jgi:hypothetical protein
MTRRRNARPKSGGSDLPPSVEAGEKTAAGKPLLIREGLEGAIGAPNPEADFEWISPDDIRSLVQEGGGGLDLIMLNLTTREHILAMPSELHYVVSGWLGWWQRAAAPVPCLVCATETAPVEGLPPAVVIMRLRPRTALDGDGNSVVEAPMLVHGVCQDCMARPDAQAAVCQHIKGSIFPDAIEIDPLHLMASGGRA